MPHSNYMESRSAELGIMSPVINQVDRVLVSKVDVPRNTFVVLALLEYRQLQNKYEFRLKNITEEDRRHRRTGRCHLGLRTRW
ncbi:hypothetical protein UPYG_G00006780 [Umbra pygmaea]|uniref:Uncharacterized protein n=1 Tax=Umbra pygmaea TaxID=75934 RepID=A0ABD0XHM5_UMBPY